MNSSVFCAIYEFKHYENLHITRLDKLSVRNTWKRSGSIQTNMSRDRK